MLRRPSLLFTCGGILALVLHHVLFTLYIDNGVVARDYWRFLHLFDDFHQGQLTVEGMLATTNGPFRSLFVPAVILLDGVGFGLPLTTIHLAALLLAACSAAVVLAFAWRHLSLDGPQVLALFCLGLVLLTPMHLYLIAYGQASLSIIRVAFYLLVMVLLAHILTVQSSRAMVVVWVVVFAFAVVVVGGGYMPSLIATVGLLSLAALRQPRAVSSKRNWMRPLMVFFVAIAAFAVAWFVLVEPEDFSGQIAWMLEQGRPLDRPAALSQFFLKVMATSILAGRAVSASAASILLIGGIAALAAIATMVLGLVSFRRAGPVALLAAGMATYSLLVAASISVARLPFGPNASLASRYLADTTLWQAAAALLVILFLVNRSTTTDGLGSSARGTVGAVVLLGILVAVHAGDLYSQWTRAPAVRARAEQMREALRTPDRYSEAELQRRLGLNGFQFLFVENGIAIMKRYRLNIFREAEPAPRRP